MRTTTINIICQLTPTFFVALARLRENQGHDDSLPYQAEVYVGEKTSPKETEIRFRKIGYVYSQPPTNEFVGLSRANAPVKQAQADQPQ